ncbi:hypothetical protein O181_096162 [Austropuccinia psidii MF-1]|uniref:Reverse transcriptase Ty1/copia-type domain-containing protein n=1 Tax=Austropuccinia psidii MF-1 TaxID=1389203 RepID=A0A9Q3PD85_9BASI|nr:hypothetical protein [Austropuccinia psidii MF-1]
MSALYTPEKNPFSKRGNQTTVNKSRCLLKDSGLSLSYWGEAANTAVYLENLTPNKAIYFQTPYFKWFEQHPSIKNLHPFGCKATSLILPPPNKFDQKGELGIFIGYGEGHQTYWILNLETDSNKADTFTISDNFYLPIIDPNVKIDRISHPNEENPTQTSNTLANVENEIPIQPIDHDLQIESTDSEDIITNQNSLLNYKGYICTNEPINKSKENIDEVGNTRNILNTSRRPKQSANFSKLTILDPKNYKKAINSVESKNWEEAISQELQNMAKHSVWSPCNELTNCKPLTTTWVLKKRTDENGNLSRFKARLCVQGLNQREGIDYSEFFSPTGRDTFRNGGDNKPKKKIVIRSKQQIKYDELQGVVPLGGRTTNDEFKYKIKQHFNMEDLGKAKYALGIRITQETNYISLLQDKFVDEILEEFNLTNYKPITALLSGNIKDLKNEMEDQPQKAPFNY